INTGANSIIGGLRLGADPANGGETRFYDNIAVTTTRAEAVNLVQGVPEPSALALGAFAAVPLGARRRRH
ncbi:MAG TPA: hypothetical protein VM511_05885, partial [Luteolibacter sp.]|nr:hypothetical protein [Luteolibacter sp.]